MYFYTFPTLVAVLFLSTGIAAAETITNTVYTSASTGGNNAGGGEVRTGSVKNSVSVTTTVHGTTEIYAATNTGPVHYEKTVTTDGSTVTTVVHANMENDASAPVQVPIVRTPPTPTSNSNKQPEAAQAAPVTASTSSEIEVSSDVEIISPEVSPRVAQIFTKVREVLSNIFAYAFGWL